MLTFPIMLSLKFQGASLAKFKRKIATISLSISKTCVLDAQKNRLIEMVLLSSHNTCLGREIKKIYFQLHTYLGAEFGLHQVHLHLYPVYMRS